MRPIRITFCITDLDLGGAERCLAELVERIDRLRFTPRVVSLAPRPAPDRAQLVGRLGKNGIEIDFLGLDRATQFVSGFRQLRRLFQSQRPDVVQTFLFHANCLGAAAAKSAGVNLVTTGIRVSDPRSRWRLRCERWMTRGAARIVCVSHSVAQFSRSHGGLPDEKLIVIPNGVDVAEYANAQPVALAQFGVGAGRRVLAYVGRLDRQKRVDRLIDVFAEIAGAIPDHDLLVVGSGLLRDALARRAVRSGVGSRIHFAPFCNDVPSILAASDALLLASDWEGMPNVVLEAMAAGRPVVTLDVEGVSQLLNETGKHQVVARQADERKMLVDFGKSVVEILIDNERRSELGRCNQIRAKEFSVERMVASYEQLYSDLLPRRS